VTGTAAAAMPRVSDALELADALGCRGGEQELTQRAGT
jgi:hypothetical protein